MLVKCIKRSFINLTIGKKYDVQVIAEPVTYGSINGHNKVFFLFDDSNKWTTYPPSDFEPVYQDEPSDSSLMGDNSGTARPSAVFQDLCTDPGRYR